MKMGSWKNDPYPRLAVLSCAAGVGLFLAYCFVLIIEGALSLSSNGETSFLNWDSSGRFLVSIALLVISLPVLLVLWWFRTHDTREQISKAEEQIKKAEQQIDASIESRETSTRDSQLSTGLQLIADTDVAARCIGLVQLALVRSRCQELEEKLRDQLQGQIDASTQDLVLYKEVKDKSQRKEEFSKLRGAMLKNMNLSGAIMTKADLDEADLQGANLVETDLKRSNLYGADLRGAILMNADLAGADLDRAKLDGAKYDEYTIFPQGFDPKARGLIKIDIT